MKIVGEVELTGIERIVINRASLWERISPELWRKEIRIPGNTGGIKRVRNKDNAKMMMLVNEYLNRRAKPKPFNKKQKLEMLFLEMLFLVMHTDERAYRAWKSGDTLNIIRKDLS